MMLEEATFEAFGYFPSELKPQSSKPVLAACDFCGEFRILQKQGYRTFCKSCSLILSEKQKGKNNFNFGRHSRMFGKHHTEETRAKQSVAMKGEKSPNYGKYGKAHPRYRGGKKLARARSKAKRRRELGYILLLPLRDGEVGHHITDEYVIGIQKEVHNAMGGRRKEHRALVLQWLKQNNKKKYNLALCILAKEPSE